MENKTYYYQNYDLKNIVYKDENGIIQIEEWLPIPEYPKYEISDLGRVESLNYNKTKKPKILKQAPTSKGYLNFKTFNEFGEKTYMTHVCVAVTFLGHVPCGTATVVDHKDNDRFNNMKTNFRMVTTRVNSDRKHLKSSSKYTGVSLIPENGKWRAIIVFEGKNVSLGCYETEIKASNVYEKELDNILNGRPIEYKVKTPSSQYKGVSKTKYSRWKAEVKINKVTYYLGTFDTEIEAHNACQEKYNEKGQL